MSSTNLKKNGFGFAKKSASDMSLSRPSAVPSADRGDFKRVDHRNARHNEQKFADYDTSVEGLTNGHDFGIQCDCCVGQIILRCEKNQFGSNLHYIVEDVAVPKSNASNFNAGDFGEFGGIPVTSFESDIAPTLTWRNSSSLSSVAVDYQVQELLHEELDKKRAAKERAAAATEPPPAASFVLPVYQSKINLALKRGSEMSNTFPRQPAHPIFTGVFGSTSKAVGSSSFGAGYGASSKQNVSPFNGTAFGSPPKHRASVFGGHGFGSANGVPSPAETVVLPGDNTFGSPAKDTMNAGLHVSPLKSPVYYRPFGGYSSKGVGFSDEYKSKTKQSTPECSPLPIEKPKPKPKKLRKVVRKTYCGVERESSRALSDSEFSDEFSLCSSLCDLSEVEEDDIDKESMESDFEDGTGYVSDLRSKVWTYGIKITVSKRGIDESELELYTLREGRKFIKVPTAQLIPKVDKCELVRYREFPDGTCMVKPSAFRNFSLSGTTKIRQDRLISIKVIGVCGHVNMDLDECAKRRISIPVWCDVVGMIQIDAVDAKRWIYRSVFARNIFAPLRLVRLSMECPHRVDPAFEMKASHWKVTNVEPISTKETPTTGVPEYYWPAEIQRLDDLTVDEGKSDLTRRVLVSEKFPERRIHCSNEQSMIAESDRRMRMSAVVVPAVNGPPDHWVALIVGPIQVVLDFTQNRLLNFVPRAHPYNPLPVPKEHIELVKNLGAKLRI